MRKYIVILLMFVCGVPGLVWGRCDSVANYEKSGCAWPETYYYNAISQCSESNKDSCTEYCKDTASPTNGCYCYYSNTGCTDKRISVTFQDVYGPNTDYVTYYYNCYGIYNATCDNDNDCYYTHSNGFQQEKVDLPMPIPSSNLYKFDYFEETDPDMPLTAKNRKKLIDILKKMCLSYQFAGYQNQNFILQTKWKSIKRRVIYQLSNGENTVYDDTNAAATSYTPLGFNELKEECEGLKVYGDIVPDDLYYEYNGEKYYLDAASSPISIGTGTDNIVITLHGSCPKNYYCLKNNFCDAKSCAGAGKFSGLPYKDLYNFVSDGNATSENECRAELKDNITFIDNNGSFVEMP